MTRAFANLTEAVRQRPPMYIADFSRSDPMCLVRALLQVVADPRLLTLQQLHLRLRSTNELELAVTGHWQPAVVPALTQAAALNLTEGLFGEWKAAMDDSTHQLEHRLLVLSRLGTVLYLVEHASVQINLAEGRVVQHFERGYLQSIERRLSDEGPALVCRLTLGTQSAVFDQVAWDFTKLDAMLRQYVQGMGWRASVQSHATRQEIMLGQTTEGKMGGLTPREPNVFLGVALTAAVAAGDALRTLWPKPRQVQSKGPRDIVTDADFAAQAIVLEHVRAAFPAHVILSEEGRHDIDLRSATPTWIIDPLDGTTNYARGLPVFAVSVALAWSGAVQVGVIHDPLRRESFYAARGGGAWLKRGRAKPQPLRVSAVAYLDEAVIGLDWAREPELRALSLAAVQRLGTRCRTLRATGSAALGLAYVGAGWVDAYFHHMLMPWDVAAAALLITEAGGVINTPAGAPWQLGDAQVAASNASLAAALSEALVG